MRTKIGAYEAKTRLPELLRQIEKGGRFTITHRGKAVADLIPHMAAKSNDTARAVADMEAFMQQGKPRSVDIKKLIEDGRA